MNANKKLEFETWFENQSPQVRKAVKKCPPEPCYKIKGLEGHYKIRSYVDEPGGICVVLVHGRDSTMPGMGVFGIKIEELKKCGCGAWKAAGGGVNDGTL